ncbi:MAG: apolipoprotein N-acyltransferase [Acidobacteria bacterium]|nr:apolipoprotein N-acyltransferase [Acidobacteriota bacterium]
MKKILLLTASALLITLAFLPWTASLPIFFFLVPAAWVALREKSWKRRFLMGVFWGALIFLFNFYWTVVPIHYYGRMSYPVSVLLFFPLMVYQMLPFTLWFVFFPYLFRKNMFLPVLLFPFLTGSLPLIFPYSISSTLSLMPVLAQTASWWGEWGLDALIVLVNVLLLTAWQRRDRRFAMAAVSVVALMLIHGLWATAVSEKRSTGAKAISAVVIQPCVRDGDSESVKVKKLFSSIGKIREVSTGKLVIIPESALPDSIVARQDFMDVMGEIRHSLHASALLFNSVVLRDGCLTNSEFLLRIDGSFSRYDKQKLMWFGERFPFYSLFRRLPIYAAGFANFSPGPEHGVLRNCSLIIATPICLECIYPGYVATLAKPANLIVNPTDDEWFGTTRATHLHFAQVRLKAIENRRYLIRATNTGYTVVVNERGQVVKDLPEGKPGFLEVNIRLLNQTTLFQRIHNWMPWIGALLFCGLFISRRRQKEE